MSVKFEQLLSDEPRLLRHLDKIEASNGIAGALLESKSLLSQAAHSLAGLRQMLRRQLRSRFTSDSERVDSSQLVLNMLGVFLSAWEDCADLGKLDSVLRLCRLSTDESEPDGPSCENSESASANAPDNTVDIEFREIVPRQHFLCFLLRGWPKLAVACDPRPPSRRARRERPAPAKPIDLAQLPRFYRFIHAEVTEDSKHLRYDVSESLEYQPGFAYVVVTSREIRVHKSAPGADSPTTVKAAEGPGKAMPGCRLGPSMMAHLVMSRVYQGCPTYRTLNDFELRGIQLPETTVRDAYARVDEYIEGIVRYIRSVLMRSYVLSTDDTRMTVLDQSAPGNKINARIWGFVGDFDRIAYFAATKNWKSSEFMKLLDGFSSNVLQGDGYAGYDKAAKDHPELVVAGCFDHARRKVHDAYLFKDPNAAWLLEQLGRVYDVERQAKAEGLGPDQLLARRRKISKPVLEKVYLEVERWQKTAQRDAFLRKALTYLCNQKSKLLAFLDDGRIPLSNTHVERLLKSVVLVRKNSLFCGSFAGAERLARYMTLVANCKIAGIDPVHYLTDVLMRCAYGFPNSRVAELIPQNWKPLTPKQWTAAHDPNDLISSMWAAPQSSAA